MDSEDDGIKKDKNTANQQDGTSKDKEGPGSPRLPQTPSAKLKGFASSLKNRILPTRTPPSPKKGGHPGIQRLGSMPLPHPKEAEKGEVMMGYTGFTGKICLGLG